MAEHTHKELSDHGRRGAKLVTMGQLARLVANLAGTVVLSRLLAPDDFGLMALVLSVAAFGELLRDFGLTTAAARSTTITQDQKSNLFWVNVGLGLVLMAIAIASSGLIASAFGSPELQSMIIWISPMFLLNGASAQFRAEINRKFHFGRLAIVESVPPVLGLIVAVTWAMISPTEMALVAQQLSTHALGLVLAIALAAWAPGLPNRRGEIRSFATYGGNLFGTQLIAYAARNGDNIMLGAVWGPAALGIYSRAFQLLMLPINQLTAPLTRVAVPVLSRVASDIAALDKFLRSFIRINILILGVGFAFAFALAPQLVLIVFGDQWVGMIPIFQALCIGGIFKALNQANFWVFLATENTGAQFRFAAWAQPLIVICMAAGLPWGAFGVAVGHSAGYALYWFLAVIRCAKVCGTSLGPQVREVAAGFVTQIIPVGILGYCCALIPNDWLAVLTGAVAAIGWISLVAWRSPSLRRTVHTIVRREIRE